MLEMNTTITLKDYLGFNKTFVIPDYQRGYVWGKKRAGEKNSVEFFIDDIITRYNNNIDIFLQGVTVSETTNEIILIDGQQRTTCIYLLMKYLGYKDKFDIRYDVRVASDEYLKNLDLNDIAEKRDEEYQDIFFFKKTLRIINDKLHDIDKTDFLNYILNNIRFLYIKVSQEQATKIFTMMNGTKAEMRQEEIIKAEILRLASININETTDYAKEWELNMLRSRYAREWDKWLHWWNKKEVQKIYCCNNNMGLLVSSYLHLKKNEELSFEKFKATYLKKGTPQEAKQTFDGLRRLQKRFEDTYYNISSCNMVGAIMRIFDNVNKSKFIKHYFVEDNRNNLRDYYKLAFLGMTHDEIVTENRKAFADKYDAIFKAINDDYIYLSENKETAFRFLLRLNIDQDILQERMFNFDIWEQRSLEHIMPKSKVGHFNEGKWYDGNDNEQTDDNFIIKREDIKIKSKEGEIIYTSEHSIGNIVLLYKNENSQFNNSDFIHKKAMFFNPNKSELFKSRHLLHTICVFAEKEDWDGEAIADNKLSTIEKFEKDYSELKIKYQYGKQE